MPTGSNDTPPPGYTKSQLKLGWISHSPDTYSWKRLPPAISNAIIAPENVSLTIWISPYLRELLMSQQGTGVDLFLYTSLESLSYIRGYWMPSSTSKRKIRRMSSSSQRMESSSTASQKTSQKAGLISVTGPGGQKQNSRKKRWGYSDPGKRLRSGLSTKLYHQRRKLNGKNGQG